MPKRVLIFLFILLAAVQLYVPGSMVMERESIVRDGSRHLFRLEPVDPNDPFRGKYLVLNFQDDIFESADSIPSGMLWVSLGKDSQGYSVITAINTTEPAEGSYLNVNVDTWKIENTEIVWRARADYPFDRFYISEDDVSVAEKKLQDALNDQTGVAVADVRILNGEAVLVDVMLDEISIGELVR